MANELERDRGEEIRGTVWGEGETERERDRGRERRDHEDAYECTSEDESLASGEDARGRRGDLTSCRP